MQAGTLKQVFHDRMWYAATSLAEANGMLRIASSHPDPAGALAAAQRPLYEGLVQLTTGAELARRMRPDVTESLEGGAREVLSMMHSVDEALAGGKALDVDTLVMQQVRADVAGWFAGADTPNLLRPHGATVDELFEAAINGPNALRSEGRELLDRAKQFDPPYVEAG